MKGFPASIRISGRETALFVLLTFISILFIVGFMFIFVSSEERSRAQLTSFSAEAFYLAESGLAESENLMREVFSQPLLDRQGEVNREVLEILDIDRAERWHKTFVLRDMPANSSAHVRVHFQNIQKTPFIGYIDEYETVPESLKTYKRVGRDKQGLRGLGGWIGDMIIESTGTYKKTRRRLQAVKKIRVTDLTPVADNYTLFINSGRDEYLKNGEFRLSNFSISQALSSMVEEIVNAVADAVIKGMGKAAISLFWDPTTKSYVAFTGDFKIKALSIIRDLVMKSSDTKIKDYVDEVIAELNPYRWGRVRTNGKLHIHLPFFLADDIINYFDDNSIFSHQRPEIGYLFCYNLLHDPYLSRYTYYEGKIIKYFQKLKPYILGVTNKPYPSFEPYTITTRFDFVNRNSDGLAPPNYDRLEKNARHFADEIHEKGLDLTGTFKNPARANGIQYVMGDLNLSGFLSGKVMFVVEGTIQIHGDLRRASANDLICLVALNKKIHVTRDRVKIEACVYSKHSLTGGELVVVHGNFVVDELSRQKGENGELIMPKRFRVNYTPDIKSGVAGNISLGVSKLITAFKDVPLARH